MSWSVEYLSLSSLNPIELTYQHSKDSEESFYSDYQTYKEGIKTINHEALVNIRDAAFSKKTAYTG